MKLCAFIFMYCGALVCGAAQWPAEISTNGISIKVYQLQPEELTQSVLSARSALSVVFPGAPKPMYGVAHFEALVSNDTVHASVLLQDVLVSKIELNELAHEDQHRINALLGAEVSKWKLRMPADEFKAAMASAKLRVLPAKDAAPDSLPEVEYEGEPEFVDADQSDVRYSCNSNLRVIHHGGRYYCHDKGNWYTADHPKGSWGRPGRVPGEVRRFPGLMGWSVDYESPDYSINVDPYSGYIRYRDKSADKPAGGKNWGRNTSKFPE